MWKLKVLIQFVLSKLPMGEQLNYLLQNLNQSRSDTIIADRIATIAREMAAIRARIPLEAATVVEIGTG